MSAVSSIHPNVSRALRVRMPTKPRKTLVPAQPQPPTETDRFCTVNGPTADTANGPTADIDSNRGAADLTETKSS